MAQIINILCTLNDAVISFWALPLDVMGRFLFPRAAEKCRVIKCSTETIKRQRQRFFINVSHLLAYYIKPLPTIARSLRFAGRLARASASAAFCCRSRREEPHALRSGGRRRGRRGGLRDGRGTGVATGRRNRMKHDQRLWYKRRDLGKSHPITHEKLWPRASVPKYGDF